VDGTVPNTVVARDENGNIFSPAFTGALHGNADTATHSTDSAHAALAAVANYIEWTNVANRPANFVFNDNNITTWNINISGNVSGNTAGTHTGPVIGNVTGNVTGNIIGQHIGNITGSLLALDSTVLVDASIKQIGYTGASLVGNLQGTLTGNATGSLISADRTTTLMDATIKQIGYYQANLQGILTGSVIGDVTGSLLSKDLQNTLIDASTKQIGYTGAALVGNLSGNVTGNVNSTDGSTVMINATTKQIGYGGANILGKLTGSVYGMVFGYDTTTLLVNGFDNKIGYAGASLAGTLTGDVKGASSVSSVNITASGVINASAGNTAANGIKFPADPGGGSGDLAWIRYYAYSGEKTNLEIGVGNDPIGSGTQDSINLVTSGGVGINKQVPRYALDVTGDIGCSALHGKADDSILWNGSNKFISTSPPTNDQGADGDFWFQREA
jgi:hypothetical protein